MAVKISNIAFALSGFAAVVAIASAVSAKRSRDEVVAMRDKNLELEARFVQLEERTEQVEAAAMQELARRLEDICAALKIDCSGEAPEAPTVPDEVLARIGKPEKSGARIEVPVPGEVSRAILSNIEILAGEVEIFPAVRNNRPDGYKITALREGGLGPALGFQVGDVIHSVNGMPFTSSEEVAKVFGALEDGRAASISFDLTRGADRLTIVLEDPVRQPKIVPVP